MILDAPLAPARDTDADQRPGTDAETRLKIIDGDVHPALRSIADLKAFLPARWREHLEIYGSRRKLGMGYEPYPKSAPRACRRDAWPDNGGYPGSDLDLIRKQYLDAYGIKTVSLDRSASPATASSTRSFPQRWPPPPTIGSASISRGRSRACGQPSSCRPKTQKPPLPRSSAVPTIQPTPRCSC